MLKKTLNSLFVFDKIIVLVILCFALLLFVVFYSKADDGLSAVVESDGKLFGIYALDGREYQFDIDTAYGHNTVKISRKSVWVTDTDCPDKTELGHKISKSGQMIVCLPNRLVVTITGKKSNVDGVTY